MFFWNSSKSTLSPLNPSRASTQNGCSIRIMLTHLALALAVGPSQGMLVLESHGHHAPNCACGVFLPPYNPEDEFLASLLAPAPDEAEAAPRDAHPSETNLTNIRQLTFGGQNAEAYWSKDGTQITYQARLPGYPDEQIFKMYADGSGKTLVSTGEGRTTCSYFSPDSRYIYFSSTHEKNKGAQAPLDMSQGYLWKVNPQFSLYRRAIDPKTGEPGAIEPVIRKREYIAETTIAPNGDYMTFTGLFEGDLEIYRSDLDGKNVMRLTDDYGYDGGPFVSWDSKKIVYRRDAIENPEERRDYLRLLKQNLVRPGKLELMVMDADGKNKRQITRLGAASFAPFIHPNGRQVIFSSNYGDPKGREFDLFVVNLDGSGLRRITHTPEFDGFPMFSRDGKKLIWASNRFGKVRGETNIFVADWKD